MICSKYAVCLTSTPLCRKNQKEKEENGKGQTSSENSLFVQIIKRITVYISFYFQHITYTYSHVHLWSGLASKDICSSPSLSAPFPWPCSHCCHEYPQSTNVLAAGTWTNQTPTLQWCCKIKSVGTGEHPHGDPYSIRPGKTRWTVQPQVWGPNRRNHWNTRKPGHTLPWKHLENNCHERQRKRTESSVSRQLGNHVTSGPDVSSVFSQAHLQ